MTLLTKSKYLAGLQCSKLLWTLVNGSVPKPSSSQQKIFDVGSNVGILATSLFSDGIKVSESGFIENINQTKELLKRKKPLFEAGFMVDNLFSRADILVPNEDGWDTIEVKSSTSVKDINIHDVSFQKYVYEKAGLKIKNCYLMYINNEYVRNGELEVDKLFKKENITEKLFLDNIQQRIDNMFKIINNEKPLVSISKNCSNPYDCILKEICWKDIPKNSVFDLTRGGKKSWELFENNILHIKDIPDDFKLSSKQQIQKKYLNEPFIEKDSIKEFLDSLEYPVYYFDFETINPCIPLYDGMRPYSRIPFQYSLHIQKKVDGPLEHVSFLSDLKDPRLDILKSMKEHLGSSGTILAWNQSFEIGVIKELISYYPSYSDWGFGVISRFNDLMIPFRNFWYYNPLQAGSCSIKKVLPIFSDLSYDGLVIKNGSDASIAYESACCLDEIRNDLERYCCLDTLAEVEILKGLRLV